MLFRSFFYFYACIGIINIPKHCFHLSFQHLFIIGTIIPNFWLSQESEYFIFVIRFNCKWHWIELMCHYLCANLFLLSLSPCLFFLQFGIFGDVILLRSCYSDNNFIGPSSKSIWWWWTGGSGVVQICKRCTVIWSLDNLFGNEHLWSL